ncbi:unnamed protein product (macronuclear) [Paramecium tetraurelia]|uniref:phosphoenolpyruvate mutase n=1 Tax=Paramecium tetraurelia TaxID=5888 RepID=A0DKN1_PARTE|nr:uncharacterized protein GSPATT00017928001 [Paramecium tetraurelia]CAK83598.1 unnamed protein product [Paramecium tetraurelia]|eukprot:XP_001450995.1 hypothetical protein (macronuclear) [Paramecium tetraurelia strain d4-2]
MFKFLLRPSSLFSKRTTKLKHLIQSKELEFIMEAHNGLSALIVQEAGFKGIWASGLSMSAQLGVRDCNEASWTQLLEVLEFMAERTTIPILMDGDTGFGNYNNARRLVRKLEERGIAGVCFEDKIFPKRNSLGDGAQELANIQEFSNKIKACKDHQRDKDFQIVARCEAFIAGWGLDSALERCEAYRKAGVDAVLIHSKKSDFTEIEQFLKAWNNRLPVVLVPTNYYKTPTEEFRKNNVSLAIWANHNLRASVKAMQDTSKQIFERQNLLGLDQIASVKEVFRLQNEKGLEEDDKKYL